MNARHSVVVGSCLLALSALGCSSKSGDNFFASTGGGSSTAGSSGQAATAGASAGGASGSGASSAGASGNGASGSGSSSAGAAGNGAAGNGASGSGAAGASSGGASSGGASSGGTSSGGGNSTAGAAGMAGSQPTTGCGASTWPPGGANAPQMIDVTNKGNTLSRQFYVSLPAGYDGTKAYPLVTVWHYAGGTAAQLIASGFGGAFYGVQKGFPDAIYVAGQGLTDTQGTMMTGWPNTNGQDVAFAKTMLTWLESTYCIDTNRVMATGMSYGGIMSNTLGCQMPDVFRAVGVMSGALFNFGGGGCVNHPIAAWITHGTADMTVDISGDETARDQYLKDNGCGTTTQPVDPAPCVAYDGCSSGNPVVWCPVEGEGHTIPNFAAGAIANFFKQF